MNQSLRNQLTEVLGIEPKQKVSRRRKSKKRNNQNIINNDSQKSLENWILNPDFWNPNSIPPTPEKRPPTVYDIRSIQSS